METTTVVLIAIGLLTVFVPAVLFDLFFPGVRASLRAEDWEMWLYWVRWLTALPQTSGLLNLAKLVAFMVLSPGLPLAGLAAVAVYMKKQKTTMMSAQTSAVWADLKDLKEYQGKDGLLLSKNIQMQLNACFGHLLVIGPTGSGKTVSFFLPNIMKLPPTYSGVFTDPKGELYQKTAAWQMAQGRRVELLKLDNKYASRCWNPLDFPKDPVMMSKICTSIVKNKGGDSGGGGGDQDFWDATAIDLLMALVYIVKALPPGTLGNFRNAYQLLAGCSFEAMIGLSKFAVSELGVKDILARVASFSDAVAPEDTRNSTRFVLKTALSPFVIDDIALITAKTDIDFCDLKREPIALYVSMPEHKVAGVKAVLSTLYMQIFDALLDMGEGGRPVFFLLDEFANVGKIIGFPQYIATIRSRNLSVSVCLQSGEQLTRNYSEAEKQEIMNNLKTMCIMPGLKEEKSLQYIQTIAGKISGYEKQSAKDEKRVFTKDRLPLNEIRELADNRETNTHETIVILPNKPPYKDLQRRSYFDPEIKTLMDKHPKVDFPVRTEKEFDEIRDACFLEPGDLTLLELIGLYINYEGKAVKVADDKKIATMKKFEELSQICGLPTVSKTEKGAVQISWPEKELDSRGRLARRMIEQSFRWMIAEKMMAVPVK